MGHQAVLSLSWLKLPVLCLQKAAGWSCWAVVAQAGSLVALSGLPVLGCAALVALVQRGGWAVLAALAGVGWVVVTGFGLGFACLVFAHS